MEESPIPFKERKEVYYRLDYYDFVRGIVSTENASFSVLNDIVTEKNLRWYRITRHTVETVQMGGWA